MKSWFLSLIPVITVLSLSPSWVNAKPQKNIAQNVQDRAAQILSDEESQKYIPTPSIIPRLDIPTSAPLVIDIPQWDITRIFSSARGYMANSYTKPAYLQTLITKDGKRTITWEAIPYMIAPQSFINGDDTQDATLIHLLRQRLPDGRLGTWRWPIESLDISVEIIWVSKYAKIADDILIEKSLWAGTQFRIRDKNGVDYTVLATKYPQKGTSVPNIQTPYSEGLATPIVIEQGKKYFDSLTKQAQKDIMNVSWNSPELREYGSIMTQILGFVENINPTHLKLPEKYKDQIFAREMDKVLALLWANGAWAFRRSSQAWASGIMQIIGPTFTTLQSLYPSELFRSGFESISGNHRVSLLAAKAHIEMQWAEYRKRPKLYEWLIWPGKPYVPYVIAAGYNSNNFDRAKELEGIIVAHPKWTPAQIIEEFYYKLRMPRWNPDETRAYMQKVWYVIVALGFDFARLPL